MSPVLELNTTTDNVYLCVFPIDSHIFISFNTFKLSFVNNEMFDIQSCKIIGCEERSFKTSEDNAKSCRRFLM